VGPVGRARTPRPGVLVTRAAQVSVSDDGAALCDCGADISGGGFGPDGDWCEPCQEAEIAEGRLRAHDYEAWAGL
jgi:hypothetical protein